MIESEAVQAFLDNPTPERYTAVVGEYQTMIRKILFRVVLDKSDAEDLAQETFLQAYTQIHRFRRKAHFSSWLYRIAHNLAYMHLRHSRRRPIAIPMENPPEAMAGNSWHPAASLHDRESDQQINDVLAALPDKLRAAFMLVCVDEIPIPQAALALGCPTATVYWRIHMARKLLKQQLSPLLKNLGASHE